MRITLTIGWKEVQQQIDLRNFYMGEAIKRREADGDIMQSCSDDKELLVSFANMACNGLITAAALRSHIINFGIDNNNITIMFEADDDCHDHLLPRIQKSITDFLSMMDFLSAISIGCFVNFLMITSLLPPLFFWCR